MAEEPLKELSIEPRLEPPPELPSKPFLEHSEEPPSEPPSAITSAPPSAPPQRPIDVDGTPGLLEQPLLLQGKRERRKTERLEFKSIAETTKKKFEIPAGSGTPLGECPVIERNLQGVRAEDLKTLHKLLFKTPGQTTVLKRNIRKFNGFSFAPESPEKEKKLTSLVKLTQPELRSMCGVLDLERGGAKDEVCERILEFLTKPAPSGRTPVERKKAPVKRKEAADGVDATDGNDAAASDSTEYGVKTTASSGKKRKKAASAASTAPRKRKPKVEEQLISSADISSTESESDDKPLADMKRPRFPTDAELADRVREILEGADLDKITMKIVCRNVYEKYPGQDLTAKKDFIKSTVKKIIS